MKRTGIHILLVEDDEDDALLTRELFDAIDDIHFEMEWASTYEEALKVIQRRRFDAYLIDYHLGEHNGLELLDVLIDSGCEDPIIMLTGLGNRELDLATMEAGATDYLVKSQINADTLERSIRYAIERKQVEKALREKSKALEHSNKELEQFAYIVSHDLQTPLHTILGFASLLRKRYQGRLDEEADGYLERILAGVERMQLLIKDVLTYSRTGTKEITKRRVDTNEVFQHILAGMQRTLEEADACVTCDSLPTIMADKTQFGLLLQNLIGNAVKYRGNRQPVVHVTAQQQNSHWCFAVCDNGIGIAADKQELIFNAFTRLHRQNEYAGTGIGLAICKKVVERHKGHIWVESEEGKGATFYFTMPL